MITCRDLADVAFDLVSGQLSPDERLTAEEHLLGCPSCIAFLESYRIVSRLSRNLPSVPLPPHLTQRLETILNGAHEEQQPRNLETGESENKEKGY